MTQPHVWKPWAIRPGSRSTVRWSAPAQAGMPVGRLQEQAEDSGLDAVASHQDAGLGRPDLAGAGRHHAGLPRELRHDAGPGGFPGRGVLRRRGRMRDTPERRPDFLPIYFDISRSMGECDETSKDGRHHRRRSGRPRRRRPCAGARHDADRAGGRPRGRRTRCGNGSTCSCSRRGNTTSIRPRRACSRRRAGIRPIPHAYPTGGELLERYLEPLATSDRAARRDPHLEPRHRHQPRRLRQGEDQGPRRRRRSRSGTRTARVPRRCAPMP